MRRLFDVGALLGALALSLLCFSLAVLLLGRRPDLVLVVLGRGALGSFYGLSETLVRMVPVLLCALAATVPAEAGMVNIGGDGQLQMGAIGAALAALILSGSGGILLTCGMVAAALLCGAAYSGVPAVLRARLGVSEALCSLFLNYVALYLLSYLVHGPLKDAYSKGWPMGALLPDVALSTRLFGTRLHSGVALVLMLALLCILVLRHTRIGIEVRAVGQNPRAADAVGIPVRWYLVSAMLAGGALAGLAGYYEIVAVQQRLRPDLSLGLGYSGFLVAWMSRGHLFLLLPLSALVAGLIVGGENLQVATGLPAAAADLLQGMLLLLVVLSRPLSEQLKRRRAVRQIMEAGDVGR